MAVTPEIFVARTVQDWAQKTATFMLSVSEQAIQSTGRCLIALSGGSTPRTLYQTIRTPEWNARFDWPRIVFLFGDDRCVGPEQPESNFGMAQNTNTVHGSHCVVTCLGNYWLTNSLSRSGTRGSAALHLTAVLLLFRQLIRIHPRSALPGR